MEISKSSTPLTYSDVLSGKRINIRQQVDLPIGHSVSLMLPTLRFGVAGYAAFASPTVRGKENAVRQSPPDRWWLLDARRGTVAVFSLCSIHHFTDARFETVVLSRDMGTVSELRQQLEELRQQMDVLAPLFFQRQEPADPEARPRLFSLLKSRIPEPLFTQHEAIAPDFFAWINE
jgi:hypothetical protein